MCGSNRRQMRNQLARKFLVIFHIEQFHWKYASSVPPEDPPSTSKISNRNVMQQWITTTSVLRHLRDFINI